MVECVVDDESALDILLGCGLVWVISSLTGELRTGAGWASSVMALSRPDVLAETRPVAGVLALDMGLDCGLSKLQISAVSAWVLELIIPGLPAAISWELGVVIPLVTVSLKLGVPKTSVS